MLTKQYLVFLCGGLAVACFLIAVGILVFPNGGQVAAGASADVQSLGNTSRGR